MAAAAPTHDLKETSELKLRQAAQKGDFATVNSLITPPAVTNVNEPGDKSGRTALHWSAKQGHANICEALLKAGAGPSLLMKDSDGKSPLDLAIFEKNDSITKLLLEWSGLASEEERKKAVDTINSGDSNDAFDYTKVKPALHSLKATALINSKELAEWGHKYVELVNKNMNAIGKRFYFIQTGKTPKDLNNITEEEELKLQQDVRRYFPLDTLIIKHCDDLNRYSSTVELSFLCLEAVTSIFICYSKFSRELDDAIAQLQEPRVQPVKNFFINKDELKQYNKIIRKLLNMAKTNLANTIVTLEKGLVPLLINPKGFIEFINNYFPGNLTDGFDPHVVMNELREKKQIDKNQVNLLYAEANDLPLDVRKEAPPSSLSNMWEVRRRRETAEVLRKIAREQSVAKGNFTSRIMKYYKDILAKISDLIATHKDEIIKLHLLQNGPADKKEDDVINQFQQNVQSTILKLVIGNMFPLSHPDTPLHSSFLHTFYISGYHLYSKIEKALSKVTPTIQEQIKQIIDENSKTLAKAMQGSTLAPYQGPTFEEVRAKEKQVAKQKEAEARGAEASMRQQQAAILYQRELEDKKSMEEKQAKEKCAAELLSKLNLKDSKSITIIMNILKPKSKDIQQSLELKKSDFFALVTKLEIPGCEGIKLNRTTCENSLTLVLGRFYSFTYDPRHGKDRADFVDKFTISHLKSMFEAVGITATTFLTLASQYAKKGVPNSSHV